MGVGLFTLDHVYVKEKITNIYTQTHFLYLRGHCQCPPVREEHIVLLTWYTRTGGLKQGLILITNLIQNRGSVLRSVVTAGLQHIHMLITLFGFLCCCWTNDCSHFFRSTFTSLYRSMPAKLNPHTGCSDSYRSAHCSSPAAPESFIHSFSTTIAQVCSYRVSWIACSESFPFTYSNAKGYFIG